MKQRKLAMVSTALLTLVMTTGVITGSKIIEAKENVEKKAVHAATNIPGGYDLIFKFPSTCWWLNDDAQTQIAFTATSSTGQGIVCTKIVKTDATYYLAKTPLEGTVTAFSLYRWNSAGTTKWNDIQNQTFDQNTDGNWHNFFVIDDPNSGIASREFKETDSTFSLLTRTCEDKNDYVDLFLNRHDQGTDGRHMQVLNFWHDSGSSNEAWGKYRPISWPTIKEGEKTIWLCHYVVRKADILAANLQILYYEHWYSDPAIPAYDQRKTTSANAADLKKYDAETANKILYIDGSYDADTLKLGFGSLEKDASNVVKQIITAELAGELFAGFDACSTDIYNGAGAIDRLNEVWNLKDAAVQEILASTKVTDHSDSTKTKTAEWSCLSKYQRMEATAAQGAAATRTDGLKEASKAFFPVIITVALLTLGGVITAVVLKKRKTETLI